MKKQKYVETIEKDGNYLAFVIRKGFNKPGCNFFPPDDFPLQLGIHLRMKGEKVMLHEHVPFKELKNLRVQEFIYIESGKAKVGIFYKKSKIEIVILNKGDMILLNCAHYVEFTEKTKIIEIKQGPYRGKNEEKKYL